MGQAPTGEVVRRLRVARGLKQKDIADAADVSQQLVSKWESGKVAIGEAHLVPVAAVLGLSVEELKSELQGAGTQASIQQTHQSQAFRLVVGGAGRAPGPAPSPAGIDSATLLEPYWTLLHNRAAQGPFTEPEVAFFRDLGRNLGLEL